MSHIYNRHEAVDAGGCQPCRVSLMALAETQVKRNCCLSLALSLPADRLQSILPATGDEQYRTKTKSRSFSALTSMAVICAAWYCAVFFSLLGPPLLCVVMSVSVYPPYTITIIDNGKCYS